MVGDLLLQQKVAFIQFWTTGWLPNDSLEFPRVFDALDQKGRFRTTGLVLSIWGNDLLDNMVSTVGTKNIKVLGSLSEVTDQLNVFLVNKDSRPRPVAIEVLGRKV